MHSTRTFHLFTRFSIPVAVFLFLAAVVVLLAASCGGEEPASPRTDATPQGTAASQSREGGSVSSSTSANTPEPTEEADKPVSRLGGGEAKSRGEVISAGEDHTCWVRTDGSVVCWGDDSSGQSTPPAGEFVSVSVGSFHSCGVRTGGSAVCWGDVAWWGKATPAEGEFSSVSAGRVHTCGLMTDGTVFCWGQDDSGHEIVVAPPEGKFASVSAGGAHTCGLRHDGTISCWGWDDNGKSTPPEGEFASVSAGDEHSCGVRTNGSLVCWGSDDSDRSTPPEGEFASVSAGHVHSCGVRTDGSVACWGNNDDGESTPPEGEFASVSAGGSHTCGVKTDGSVTCWGWDFYGQATPPGAARVSAAEPTLAPAATPAPRPTESPLASQEGLRIAGPCTSDILKEGVFTGVWRDGCPLDVSDRSKGFAHYYRFRIADTSLVVIELAAHASDAAAGLALLQGEVGNESVLAFNSDIGFARMQVQLAPGEYTIEAKATRQVVGNPYFDLYFDIPDTAAAPAPTAAPTDAPDEPATLEEYAAEHAGGPGAVYVGDLAQLAGQSSTMEWGTTFGRVTLESLEHHLWLYESAYYQSLIEKANLTNPTELTSSGESIRLRFACMNYTLHPCILLQQFLAPDLNARTNGRLILEVSGFPEWGIAGPDTLARLRDGTLLDAATIYGGYVAGQLPQLEIQNLWGIYSSREQEFEANQAIIKNIDELVLDETGGVIMNHSWHAGNDQFMFCRERIDTPDDFEGRKISSFSAAMSDWLNGMGADAHWVNFAELYTSLERSLLDCAVASAGAAYGQRWYEVANYMIGPLPNFSFSPNVINADVWRQIPSDLQQIILEEAAKSELEALRMAAIENEIALQINIDNGGLEFVPFSGEMNRRSLESAMNSVIPNWVDRVGGPEAPIVADTFNNEVGPIVGLRIQPNGEVVKTN